MKKPFEPARNPIAAAPVDPPLAQPADPALRVAVRQALAADGCLTGMGIEVLVEGGSVTLSGAVPSEFLRVLADACASAVPGVLVVRNRLTVPAAGPF